ncbi:MAG: hypothetical protein K1X39_04595 [Thermoflexales bacterium]|nr:hypothetical protein [Thermoflexales bacterium]
MTFTIFPAIDLRGGQVVRLRQGDPAQSTAYAKDPLAVASRWLAAGAAWLHVVNLDGAFGDATGAAINRNALAGLAALAARNHASLQLGGGLRSLDDLQAAIDAGAQRVIIGTAAVENPALVEAALARFGAERIVVGLDARAGMIVTRGWQSATPISAADLGCQMAAMGVRHALFTEVGRDGMLSGPAAEMTAAIAQLTDLAVLASGGVRNLDDVRELRLYAPRGVAGVVVGRALYEGTLDLGAALALAETGG